VTPPGRDDDVAGTPRSAIGAHDEPIGNPMDPLDGGVGLDRCAERTCVAVEVSSEVGCAHVAVGVGALVAMAGKTAHPVRGERAQRVPSFAHPALTDTATVEDHVVVAESGQVPACGEPGLPGADDDRVD